MNLPTKEECESWSPVQVAHFMCQKQMPECAETVNIFQIDGHRLLSLSHSDICKFSLTQQPQLQKIVQDINKSEGSLLDKLRRLKVKSGPKLPQRDYQGEHMQDTERWSDESDEYENPQAEGDSYEPPPTPRVFPSSLSTLPYSRDLDYLDSRNRSEPPPSRPQRPPKPKKPLLPKPRQLASDDDEDYIDPERGHQDNYIEPTEKLLPSVNSSPVVSKPLPKLPCDPVVYEVPLPEEVPPVSRFDPNTLTKPLPPKVSPRLIRPVRPIIEPPSDTEYEVCEPDNNPPKISLKPDMDPPQVPKPFPREHPHKPVLPIRPPFQHKEHQSQSLPLMSTGVFTADFTRPMIPLPQILNPIIPPRQDELNSMGENGLQNMDKESNIHRQPWYANTCDRKTAEEVLIQSNRDGSFMVRNSSGLDPQQPYTLVVFYNGKVYNVPVRFIQATQQYALGREKKGEERFTSISRIIDNHLKNPLVLIDSQSNTRDTTRLEYAMRP